MSTTFYIMPTKVDDHLTFKNVLELARHTLRHQLEALSIPLKIQLSVDIHGNKESYIKTVDSETKFVWEQDEYAWFKANEMPGGTDAYCRKIDENLSIYESCSQYIEEALDGMTVTENMKEQILDCEYEWWFRRSAGQPPLINLAYGHLAAAVAKLSDGYIYSNDGGWHDRIFPATADQFLGIYFYPDKATNPEDYDWVISNLEGLKLIF